MGIRDRNNGLDNVLKDAGDCGNDRYNGPHFTLYSTTITVGNVKQYFYTHCRNRKRYLGPIFLGLVFLCLLYFR